MVVTHNISEYIQKNESRKNVRWQISNGKWLFEGKDGNWLSQEAFDMTYPKYDYAKFNDKGVNPDKTKIK